MKKNREAALSAKWEEYLGCKDARLRNEIALGYYNIVKILAAKMIASYRSYAEFDDMLNQGFIALIDAVEKYDPNRGVKFETFSSIIVKGALIDFIRVQDRVPRPLRKSAIEAEEAFYKLSTELGKQPTHFDVAKSMGISAEQLSQIKSQAQNFDVLSYEEVVWQKMHSVSDDYIDDSVQDSPESKFMEDELKEQLAGAVDSLPEQYRIVLTLYYRENRKLKEIAGLIGVTEGRVSQIRAAAICKLRSMLLDTG